MNFEEHLLVGWVFTGTILFFLSIYGFNVLEAHNLPYIIIGVSVFSVLPDIDHAKSKPSHFLSICLLVLALYSIMNYYLAGSASELLEAGFLFLLFIIHRNYAISSRTHRRFPHTFTFGVLSSAIIFFLTNSLMVSAACFTSFLSHLIVDKHLVRAIRNDKKIFRKIIR